MDSFSSMARIFSVSLYWMADLMPRRTLRRSSSLLFIASTRSFCIFSERVIGSSGCEYSRGSAQAGTRCETKRDGHVFAGKKRREKLCGLFDLKQTGRYRLCFSLGEFLPLWRRSTLQKRMRNDESYCCGQDQ